MSCDVGEATEGSENELRRRSRDGMVGEGAVTYLKRRNVWRLSCDVGEPTERFESEL